MTGMVTVLDVAEGSGGAGGDPDDLLGVLDDVGIGQERTALVPASSSSRRDTSRPPLVLVVLVTALVALTLAGGRRRISSNGKEHR
jgi:hypothetical protein